MSQDQAEAPTRSPEEQTRGTAEQPQAGAEARAEPHQPPPEDRRPVKTGRAILLLAVAAAAVAYSGISGRHHDDQKLKQWTRGAGHSAGCGG